MTMPPIARGTEILAAVAVVVLLSGCPSAEQTSTDRPTSQPVQTPVTSAVENAPAQPKSQPAKSEQQQSTAAKADESPSPEKDLSRDLERVAETPPDLGPPLVDHPDKLVKLSPDQPVWLDKPGNQVVLQGEVCRAGYPLEFFATYANRSYEAVVAVNVRPRTVHAGLLALGAEVGHPAQFKAAANAGSPPEIIPATGTEVAIEVRWRDKDGKAQSAPAQDWIRDIKTRQPLKGNWVFAGSMTVTDQESGQQFYQADGGELICVLSSPTAMLDLPIRSYGALESRSFEAFAERLPPVGTPVTLLLKPNLSAKPSAQAPPPSEHAEQEKAAIEAAEAWLALVDKGEYARGWETAAEYMKNRVERRELIKAIGAVRTPLGPLKSRERVSATYTTSLPGVPDGQYVIIKYKTTFANKKSATETVTPMLEGDKKWRISGYVIE